MSITQGDILRMGGKYPLRNGMFIWSEDAFKEAFQVGDIIRGGVSIVGKITAIGRKRFLFQITRYKEVIIERVGTISTPRGWGKP